MHWFKKSARIQSPKSFFRAMEKLETCVSGKSRDFPRTSELSVIFLQRFHKFSSSKRTYPLRGLRRQKTDAPFTFRRSNWSIVEER